MDILRVALWGAAHCTDRDTTVVGTVAHTRHYFYFFIHSFHRWNSDGKPTKRSVTPHSVANGSVHEPPFDNFGYVCDSAKTDTTTKETNTIFGEKKILETSLHKLVFTRSTAAPKFLLQKRFSLGAFYLQYSLRRS